MKRPFASRAVPGLIAGIGAGLAALVVAGCWTIAGTPAAGVANRASLRLHPMLGTGRVVQSAVAPYGAADVDHLVVTLATVAGGTESAVVGDTGALMQDVASGSLGGTVVFGDLHPSTTYRVRGYAYARPGTASADLLSVDDQSYLDIAVATDDRPAIATLSIQLRDKAFAGAGTGSIAIKDGGIADVGGETVQ